MQKTPNHKNIDGLTDKLQEILKIPASQNIPKNRMDFPMHEQSISNSKTEAIIHGMIQNTNREIPFYPDPIHRSPPKPTESLWSPRIENKTDASSRIDFKFEEISLYQEGIISETYQKPDTSYFPDPKN